MPDADDFDVEYFRNLLKDNSPKEGHAPPAKPAPTVARITARPSAKQTQSGKTGKPPTGPKRRNKR